MAQQGTRRILVELLGDESSLQRSFQKGGKEAEKFGLTLTAVTRSTGGFSRGFLSGAGALSSFGGALALTSGSFFAGAGLVAGLKASVGAAANFQQTMNVLKQVTAGTSSELAAASREARQLGADITLPATSASDAAQAMLQLAKGGLTLKQSMDAARGTLQLAAAAQTDVGTAADTTARALTAFGLSGDNAGAIADALANAAQSATGDITDFALGLSQSATSAHQFGLTAQDTVTALTELAKAGIVGSDAGTSLRVMLTRLLPTSKAAKREMTALGVSVKDAKGNFLPFRDIIQQYSRALAKLPPASRQFALQTIFGTDAQRAANIILQQSVGTYDRLNAVVSRQGGAARAAAAQQKGFKGALDGFNSALQTTEVTLGTALLPVLGKYLRELAAWLGTTQHQEELQHKVTTAVRDTTTVIKDSVVVVKSVTDAFGGLKNTLELIIALKFASKITAFIGPLSRFTLALKALRTTSATDGLATTALSAKDLARQSKIAEARAAALRATLGKLAAIGVITVAIELFINKNKIENSVDSFLKSHGAGFLVNGKIETKNLNLDNIDRAIVNAKIRSDSFVAGALEKYKRFLEQQDAKNVTRLADGLRANFNDTRSGARGASVVAQAAAASRGPGGAGSDAGTTRSRGLTAAQRNTFFDNDIARILQRGGLGNINQQIQAIKTASALISQRISVTKDVTRKLNLEDQLLSLASQAKGLRQQQVQGFIDSLQFNVDKAAVTATLKDDLTTLQALQHGIEQQIKTQGKTLALQQSLFDVNQKIASTRQQQRDRRQFALLGLGPTGGDLVPIASTLRRQAQQVSDEIAGTTLGTKKNTTLIAHIRQLLNLKGLSAEVRTGIKNILDGIDEEFKKHGAQTRTRRVSVDALLAGAGLSAEQIRLLRERFSQVSPAGTAPGKTSLAFSGAGAVNKTDIFLDGKKISSNTTEHQVKAGKRRTSSRRG